MRWGLTIALLICGCSGDNFKKVYLLENLRVLSLAASQPEVNAGSTVTITPFISDRTGEGRALSYRVIGCTDPGVTFGSDYTCDGQSDRQEWVPLTAIPALTAPFYSEAAPTFSVTVPSTILSGRSTDDQFNGVAYLVFYEVVSATETVTALKRIFATSRTTKNTNPVPTSILADGTTIAARPQAQVTLTVDTPAAQFEDYETSNLGQTVSEKEDLLYSWYVSDGELTEERSSSTKDTKWTPANPIPAVGQTLLILVTRDRRGGESVQRLIYP
jgi:hypothetical protein